MMKQARYFCPSQVFVAVLMWTSIQVLACSSQYPTGTWRVSSLAGSSSSDPIVVTLSTDSMTLRICDSDTGKETSEMSGLKWRNEEGRLIAVIESSRSQSKSEFRVEKVSSDILRVTDNSAKPEPFAVLNRMTSDEVERFDAAQKSAADQYARKIQAEADRKAREQAACRARKAELDDESRSNRQKLRKAEAKLEQLAAAHPGLSLAIGCTVGACSHASGANGDAVDLVACAGCAIVVYKMRSELGDVFPDAVGLAEAVNTLKENDRSLQQSLSILECD